MGGGEEISHYHFWNDPYVTFKAVAVDGGHTTKATRIAKALCRSYSGCNRDTHFVTRSCMVFKSI
jgi:hypothetical protein